MEGGTWFLTTTKNIDSVNLDLLLDRSGLNKGSQYAIIVLFIECKE